ncbi:MAG: proline--tRNA ligase [Polyangiales bacterium]
MRYARCFIPTLREDPAEARKNPSHRLLLRAGYIRQVGAGIYEFLPLGLRVLRRVEAIVREEMDRAGALEVAMPALLPAELFKETGRWDLFGSTLFRLRDQKGHDHHLGPTHEEVITDMVRASVRSYRQLPVNLYQIQWKFRDEARPRAGLLRCREFLMKDAYSFDVDEAGALRSYHAMRAAYERVFRRVGLRYVVVAADSGAMGGSTSAEFQILAETGEDAIVVCPACNYAATVEAATAQHAEADLAADASRSAAVEVATPGKRTIEDVAEFLGVATSQTVKAGAYMFGAAQGDPGRLAVAFVRGDRRFNEVALARELGAQWIRAAEDDELSARGVHAGYVGPLGLSAKVDVALVDAEIGASSDVVVGANRPGFHLRGADLRVALDELGDRGRVASVRAVGRGDACPACGAALEEYKGIEGGHVFVLGTHYTAKMGARFLDEKGVERDVVMGCYGIGVSRLVAAAVEQRHDADGLSWPMSIAPYHVIVTPLSLDGAVGEAAASLYEGLRRRGVDVLFDDRDERPGVKFKDADLLGIPLRVTVGKKSLDQGKVELKTRGNPAVELVDLDAAEELLVARIRSALTESA